MDDSAAGKFTARIAGLLAGARGMPLTIVHLGEESQVDDPSEGLSRQVKEGAKSSAAVMTSDDAEPNPGKVHLTSCAVTQNDANAVVEEGCKGYDLLMVGIGKTHDAEGIFDAALTKLSHDFNGPLAILASDGSNRLPKLNSDLRVLVPINGTPAARRAAEVAFAIARPTGARVTALYVSAGGSQTPRGRSVTRSREEATLKDIAELGERYDVHLRTALRPKANAERAILTEAGTVYGLIVMGGSRRQGDQLFFGNTANAILKKWEGPVLFVAT